MGIIPFHFRYSKHLVVLCTMRHQENRELSMKIDSLVKHCAQMVVAILWVCSSISVNAGEHDVPSDLVAALFVEMNTKLQDDQKLIEENREHLLVLGEEVLGPYVAFQKMAKQVLGKNWKKITEDQQQRYSEAFKNRVSLAMVSQYDPTKKYSLKITGERKNKKGNRAVVKSIVNQIGGASSYAIDYKLYMNKKVKNWQVYDVIVEGISVLQSFKSASADEIKKNGIEKLIEQLEVKPKEKEEVAEGKNETVVAVIKEKE